MSGTRYVIRGFTSGATHLADVPAESLQQLVSFGVECTGSLAPLAALCRTLVGRSCGVVVMRKGTRVSCSLCKRLGHGSGPVTEDEALPISQETA